MNCGGYETMPYAVCVHATAIQGDVGFGKYDGSTARIALGGDLLQVIFYPIAADVHGR